MQQGCWADWRIGRFEANAGLRVRSWVCRQIPALFRIIIALGLIFIEAASAQSAGDSGTVKFFVDAGADFSAWLDQPTDSEKQFMRDHYYRMQTYAPDFDSRLSWYPNAWEYQDSYAMHVNGSTWVDHPDWVLKDANGNYLYIPFACNGNTCPQYAGDIGNPDFRAHWIASQQLTMQSGYLGIWIDDVNMASIKVGDGSGSAVVPIDPRTGQAMALEDWRRYFAEFVEDIRAAFPDHEIAHNVHWWADMTDTSVSRQLLAADYINLERGISDGGITRGTGKYSFETFIDFVDWLHSQGRHVIFDDDDDSGDQARDYELSFYYLVNDGGDLLGADGDRGRMTPDSFWSGYTSDLGTAAGTHYKWNELFRRDFECGMVLVNQPGMPPITVDLDETFDTLDGQSVTSVTLAASSGHILSKACGPANTMIAVDDAIETPMGESVIIDVFANDEGLENGPFQILIRSEPSKGSAVINTDMQVAYTPEPDNFGIDFFQYEVSDRDGSLSTLATVTVTIINPEQPEPALDDPVPGTDSAALDDPVPETDSATVDDPVPGTDSATVDELGDAAANSVEISAVSDSGSEGDSATATQSGGKGSSMDVLSIVLILSGFWVRHRIILIA